MSAEAAEEFPWMPIALAERGTVEVTGGGDNPRILEYLRTTTLPANMAAEDETAWCSAFVNWCVEQAGIRGTRSAAARSWLEWGKAIEVPRRGCIAVFSRPTASPTSAHVAFYISTIAPRVAAPATGYTVLGGNQMNRVGVNVYAASRLLGFRVAA